MRRALQAAGPLLRRSTRTASACSELCAASGPALAAAAGWPGGGGGGGPLILMPWALRSQAALHASAAAQLASRSSDSASGAESSYSGNPQDSAAAVLKSRGRPRSPVPDVDAGQLLRSLGLDGTAQPAKLLANLRKLPGVRQQGVLDNAAAVAAHLLSPAVGLTRQQVEQLLERRPWLFSRPPEQRAAVLFGELMAAGVTAAAAAVCFAALPKAARVNSVAHGLAELAAILAHSQHREGGRGRRAAVAPAQRTVAALLSQTPSAVPLVCNSAGYLQQRATELQQAGFSAADVAALAWTRPELLWRDAAAKVASSAAVVQQVLGLPADKVVSLVARRKPRWLTSSIDTLRERAAALVEAFGQSAAAAVLLKSPEALGCDPAVWRRNLCYMAACGVADPKALLQRAPVLLHVDHAAPSFLQRRLLLQRAFGLAAAQLYEQQTHRLMYLGPAELAQRLQFVEQRGQAHRLVAKAIRGPRPATAASPLQRAITVRTVGRPLREFLAALGASQAEWAAWAAANPPGACPLYRWAQQAAGGEAARLAAALPPELAQAERRQQWKAPPSWRRNTDGPSA